LAIRTFRLSRIDGMNTVLRGAAGWNCPLMIFVGRHGGSRRRLGGRPLPQRPAPDRAARLAQAVQVLGLVRPVRHDARLDAVSVATPQPAAERVVLVILAMSVAEMAVVVTQVVRGDASHVNQTSTVNAILWQVMGSAIMVPSPLPSGR
jgi:hypothetical protein